MTNNRQIVLSWDGGMLENILMFTWCRVVVQKRKIKCIKHYQQNDIKIWNSCVS